jgi:hypothetical protein
MKKNAIFRNFKKSIILEGKNGGNIVLLYLEWHHLAGSPSLNI